MSKDLEQTYPVGSIVYVRTPMCVIGHTENGSLRVLYGGLTFVVNEDDFALSVGEATYAEVDWITDALWNALEELPVRDIRFIITRKDDLRVLVLDAIASEGPEPPKETPEGDLIRAGDQLQSEASRMAEWIRGMMNSDDVYVPYEVGMAAISTQGAVDAWTEARVNRNRTRRD